MINWPNGCLMLGHRLRRRPNIKQPLGQFIMVADTTPPPPLMTGVQHYVMGHPYHAYCVICVMINQPVWIQV